MSSLNTHTHQSATVNPPNPVSQESTDALHSEKEFTEEGAGTRLGHQKGRHAMIRWSQKLQENVYQINPAFQHSIHYYFGNTNSPIEMELQAFGNVVAQQLEPVVAENDFRLNLPRLEAYNGIGERIDEIVHHPKYVEAGDLIYGNHMMEKLLEPGHLLESLTLFYLSSHAGEAGHNCPVACTAGIIRVLQKTPDFPEKAEFLKKLTEPSYSQNFTGAQFITEIQGGSDVALNDTVASLDEQGNWRIRGEKWFCSNANADLILLTARFDEQIPGTPGLGLFLVPARLPNQEKNQYRIRRLKEKIGTRTMASGEIDFLGAFAYPLAIENGFKMLMSNVLHLSRIYNTFAVLGSSTRAFQIAKTYTQHRIAFGQPVVNYPLIQENLARTQSEILAILASVMATTQLQDQYDRSSEASETQALLLRLLANLNKYISALWGVEHIHHSIDMLAGNGTIESTSALPRLFRDSIVFENWEGTHNTLRMQILRDIHKFQIDEIFLQHVRTLLDQSETQDAFRTDLEQGLIRLQQGLSQLKQASPALQSLQIRAVLDQMIILYASIQLWREGLHQQKTEASDFKLKALQLFHQIHLHPHPVEYNDSYLALIRTLTQ